MEMMDALFANDFAGVQGGLQSGILVLLVTFIVGHIVSWSYMWTHSGLSYSQMFCSSLVVLPMLVAMIMMLLSGNIVIALGLMAVFAMIRFRNVLKDTRDTAFILWSIVEGVATGTGRFGLALAGAVCLALVFGYLRMTSFGGRHRYDVVLSLEWTGADQSVLGTIMRRHAMRAQLASQHDLDANRLDLSYRLLLRDPTRSRELLQDLESTAGVVRVSLFHRQDESEV